MRVPMLDLKAQYETIRAEVVPAVTEVMESQNFILGSKVEELEKAIAGYCGRRYGVGMSSGTDAILAALMAAGVKPGDEVITTPYTFFATAGCVSRLCAKPVFVDIEPEGYNIDVRKIAARVTKRTVAVMPVHLYGQCAEMDGVLEIAREHKLAVIEDAAQAIGSEYKGRRAGSMGDFGCFSFFPSKNLGGVGDGGMVTVEDEEQAEKLRVLRSHGSKPKYHHRVVGGNFRLDAIQAAVLLVKLKHLDGWTEARQRNAARYEKMFRKAGLTPGTVGLPKVIQSRHIYNQYVIRVERRDKLMAHLEEEKIGCAIYYPVPLHLQECFRGLGYKEGDMPESERAAQETLALPIYPELTAEQQEHVVESIAGFYS